jgi:N-methylhydantoinase A/oxoprolinase/acetone carboxylase beta subunit
MIVGLDVGGTHTDVVVLQGREIVSKVKLPTDHVNLLDTVCSGISEATKDLDPQSIERMVVSTTLATNAIVQEKTEPVGILVASGPGVNPIVGGQLRDCNIGPSGIRPSELCPPHCHHLLEWCCGPDQRRIL